MSETAKAKPLPIPNLLFFDLSRVEIKQQRGGAILNSAAVKREIRLDAAADNFF